PGAGAEKGKAKAKDSAKGGGLNVLVGPQSAGGMMVVPMVNQDAFTYLPDSPGDPPLPPAPDTALVEKVSDGFLPRIGRDGRRPWQVYARPGPAAGKTRPRIAIIIGRLGPNRPGGIETIRRLPGPITLAFDFQIPSQTLGDWVARARQAGHEVLFTLPAHSISFPLVDHGPRSLRAAAQPEENIKIVEAAMKKGSGNIGFLLTAGAEIVTNEQALRPVLKAMSDRGLMIVDGGGLPSTLVPRIANTLGQAAAGINLEIDAEASRAAIDQQLAKLESLAQTRKAAVGLGHALPVTLERLIDWIPTLKDKGIVLVPVSSIAGRQGD
ncbi:MAG: divergent polysaccharide deacetylase family protein, partial [Alphaproteobacteria bacterium]|nr:divergent polysaccharide deacetylase family protein [Alphaproteobacteria bacterium]